MCNSLFLGYREEWWEKLSEAEQVSVATIVGLLENLGPKSGFPYSSGVFNSNHSHMRELRIQHAGNPYRILYAFDPRQIAILLLGGDKTGDDRWYESATPKADLLYDEHLKILKIESLIHE